MHCRHHDGIFAALRQIQSVRHCLPQHALLTLIRALVVSKVDYCCSERFTPLLRDLYWLRVPERIQFRLCVLAFQCLNGSAPPYLAESVCRTADVEGRRHLHSSTTVTLVVPSVQRSTLGDRAFPVAASRAWNSLPPAIRTVSSFTSFQQQLKTHLFRLSFA